MNLSPKTLSSFSHETTLPLLASFSVNSGFGKYKAIAFLVPNQDSDKSLYDFVVPIETLESMTGIDFFPNLKNLKQISHLLLNITICKLIFK